MQIGVDVKKNKYVSLLFGGSMLLFSCENRRIKACDSCQKDTLTESCENEQKAEKTHEGVFFYYEADEVSAIV